MLCRVSHGVALDGHRAFTSWGRVRGASLWVLSQCSAMDPTSLWDWGSPLVFWNLAVRRAWELPGWAEVVVPTKHSAATCRLSSVLCLILSRLLKISVTAVIHPLPWPLPSAPKPLIPFCSVLVCVEPPQLIGCCILAQFLGAGSAASVHASKSHLLDLFTFNLVYFCAVQTALFWGVFWHFSSPVSRLVYCCAQGSLK